MTLSKDDEERVNQVSQAINRFTQKAEMLEGMVKGDAIDPGLPLALAFSGKPLEDIRRIQETTEFMEKTQPKLAKYMRDLWNKHGERIRAENRKGGS